MPRYLSVTRECDMCGEPMLHTEWVVTLYSQHTDRIQAIVHGNKCLDRWVDKHVIEPRRELLRYREALNELHKLTWPTCPDGDPTSCGHETCNHAMQVSLIAYHALYPTLEV